MSTMRLQKFLSAAGVCSRREGERWIAAGRVFVNGRPETTPGTKIDAESDRVVVDGQPVRLPEELCYIALHKPPGVVTSCRHPGEKLVVDLVDLPIRLFPVGRLDKASTGLLILTNDGRLHHHLSHPSFDHEKEYVVDVRDPIPAGALRKLAAGMPILGSRTRPAVVEKMGARRFRIILQEGRNRQIRRMVQKVGNEVRALHRVRISTLRLGRLPEGKWRHLTETEKQALVGPLAKKKISTIRSRPS